MHKRSENFGFNIVMAGFIPMILYAMNAPIIYCFFVTWLELIIALAFYYVIETKHGALVYVYRTAIQECGCLQEYHYAPELAVTFLEHKGWIFNFERGWYHPLKSPRGRHNWKEVYLAEFDDSYIVPEKK